MNAVLMGGCGLQCESTLSGVKEVLSNVCYPLLNR